MEYLLLKIKLNIFIIMKLWNDFESVILKSKKRPNFAARDVLCPEKFCRNPKKIKRTDLTAMGKSLARLGCNRAGQSNKKGDHYRYWIKPEK